MQWKGNCAQLQVKNVGSVVKMDSAVKCRVTFQESKVHAVEEEVFYIHSICGRDQAFISLSLNNSASVSFQIDTSSTANILPLQEYIN